MKNKTAMLNWILTLTVASLLVACQINIGKPVNPVNWKDCREIYSESETLRALTGRWQLAATGCGDCSQPGPNKATEQVTLVIYSDQRIETFRDGKLVGSTGFRLKNSYNPGYFTLETIPIYQNQYTYGIIEFCEGRLVFNSGYTDGAIYYFERLP